MAVHNFWWCISWLQGYSGCEYWCALADRNEGLAIRSEGLRCWSGSWPVKKNKRGAGWAGRHQEMKAVEVTSAMPVSSPVRKTNQNFGEP